MLSMLQDFGRDALEFAGQARPPAPDLPRQPRLPRGLPREPEMKQPSDQEEVAPRRQLAPLDHLRRQGRPCPAAHGKTPFVEPKKLYEEMLKDLADPPRISQGASCG